MYCTSELFHLPNIGSLTFSTIPRTSHRLKDREDAIKCKAQSVVTVIPVKTLFK